MLSIHISSFVCSILFVVVVIVVVCFVLFCFGLFRAPAYGSPQARGQIGTTAAGLHHGHSNAGSKPCLQLASQLTAMPDP